MKTIKISNEVKENACKAAEMGFEVLFVDVIPDPFQAKDEKTKKKIEDGDMQAFFASARYRGCIYADMDQILIDLLGEEGEEDVILDNVETLLLAKGYVELMQHPGLGRLADAIGL